MRALLTGASRARLRASGDFYEKKRKMIEKFWPILCRRSEPVVVSLHQVQHADLIDEGCNVNNLMAASLPFQSKVVESRFAISWKKKKENLKGIFKDASKYRADTYVKY